VAGIDEHVAVVPHHTYVYQKPAELHLSKILQAIAGSAVVQFEYTSISKQEQLLRKAEPVGIYYQGSHWYFIAFCRLRNDYRNFRTDKIKNLVTTSECITKNHPPLRDFLIRLTEKKQLQKVVIEVSADIVKYFGEQKYYNGFLKEEPCGSQVRMTFLTASLSGFARWYLLFGEEAEIIEPASLKEMVGDLAEKILKKLEQSQLLLT
jgi:predicted DNA-binding transcriptional regulator YafY